MAVQAIRWAQGCLSIVDQTQLPGKLQYVQLDTEEDVWNAIQQMKVRGAPAIGCCAAHGLVVGVRDRKPADLQSAKEAVIAVSNYLATSRPTAYSLFWALDRMRNCAAQCPEDLSVDTFMERLVKEAHDIQQEDAEMCQLMGNYGAEFIKNGDGILTHCNTGALATGGYGTALSAMFRAHAQGKRFQVYAGETRPLLQGARLTAWELMDAGIDVTLICDNTAAQVMKEGKIQQVFVGADRIAANGDTANKVGTYSLAVLAQAHNIPFYVVAPSNTFDAGISNGDTIPIEERCSTEVTHAFGQLTAPPGVSVYCPAFDVTPNTLITAFITERGILKPPYTKAIQWILDPHKLEMA